MDSSNECDSIYGSYHGDSQQGDSDTPSDSNRISGVSSGSGGSHGSVTHVLDDNQGLLSVPVVIQKQVEKEKEKVYEKKKV